MRVAGFSEAMKSQSEISEEISGRLTEKYKLCRSMYEQAGRSQDVGYVTAMNELIRDLGREICVLEELKEWVNAA